MGAPESTQDHVGPLLVATGVRRSFGEVVAVDVDRFEVAPGEAVALIGPNGAGKTTFFDVLTGFERPDRGTWSVDGRQLGGRTPDRIARSGVARTFQLPRVWEGETVLGNVVLGAAGHPGERLGRAAFRPWWRGAEAAAEHRARELLDELGLGGEAGAPAGTLSGGQRKLLELARALMGSPRLLMLDEPTAGVSPALTGRIADEVRRLLGTGLTVVFIEHDLDLVAQLADRVVCMAAGRIIADGPAVEVRDDPAVLDAYLGSTGDRR